jgi:hypothetical protein
MKIVTSLSFRGNCREAFEFYASSGWNRGAAGSTR